MVSGSLSGYAHIVTLCKIDCVSSEVLTVYDWGEPEPQIVCQLLTIYDWGEPERASHLFVHEFDCMLDAYNSAFVFCVRHVRKCPKTSHFLSNS